MNAPRPPRPNSRTRGPSRETPGTFATVPHVLVTNDFPPKLGGIQSYLWELWRRLDPASCRILTHAERGAGEFDRAQPWPVERTGAPVLLPTPGLVRRTLVACRKGGARLAVIDPVLPLGLIGPALAHTGSGAFTHTGSGAFTHTGSGAFTHTGSGALTRTGSGEGAGIPYAVVLHGAELTVPGRLPVGRAMSAYVLSRAAGWVAAGGYPAAEARRVLARARGAAPDDPPVHVIPPGVDVERFRPLGAPERAAARKRRGIAPESFVVLCVSRLVPRKGIDVLISAVAELSWRLPEITLVVAGAGRDRARLEGLARRRRAPVTFAGRVADAELPELYGLADLFVMPCRDRWQGLEQEGFGIVFLEAAACGVPQVAGASGGAAEAVVDGVTGRVLDRPGRVRDVAAAIVAIAENGPLRAGMGAAARRRAEERFAYPVLAAGLAHALGDIAEAAQRSAGGPPIA